MKETRKLYRDDLRRLCIEKNWYTLGNNDDYSKMLDKAGSEDNVSTDLIVDIATDIYHHSEKKYSISNICYAISRICNSFFSEE